MAEGEAPAREAVLELLAPRPGERLLDLACGPGTLTFRVAEAAPDGEVVGVDLAPGMLEAGRRASARRGLRVRFELMDIEQLDFADAEFDGAICGHGFQFCPDLSRALAEARRVLRKGGRLAASVPADRGDSAAEFVLKRVESSTLPPAPTAVDRDRTLAVVSDLELFKRAALDAGFSEARTSRLEELRTWPNATAMVDNISSWWATASRLEQLDERGRERFKRRALEALTKEFGQRPIPVHGAAHLLYSVA